MLLRGFVKWKSMKHLLPTTAQNDQRYKQHK